MTITAPDLGTTTTDYFLGGRLVIRQPRAGYRAGSDPVFLAATVVNSAATVLDIGAGVGTAGLCVATRLAGVTVTALEMQSDLAQLAVVNAQANGLEARFRVICASLTDRPHALRGRVFDQVVTNPPWYPAGTISPPAQAGKAIGHLEGRADLGEWLRLALRHVRPKGRLLVVHRGDRLGDILTALAPLPVGEIRVLPLWPKAGGAAGRVVVAACKDSRAPMALLPGLVLHQDDGTYTPQAEAVLRLGLGLDI